MPTFSIFDILVRGPVLSSLKMIGIANVFFSPPLVFEVLSFPHPLLFPLSAPPSRAFCCRFPLPLLQFKLKTGIMREVMGRRQQRGKSKSAA